MYSVRKCYRFPLQFTLTKVGAGMTKKTDGFDESNPYLTPTLVPLKSGGNIEMFSIKGRGNWVTQ